MGESKVFNLAFNRTACSEINSDLTIAVQSCVAGGTDCSDELELR